MGAYYCSDTTDRVPATGGLRRRVQGLQRVEGHRALSQRATDFALRRRAAVPRPRRRRTCRRRASRRCAAPQLRRSSAGFGEYVPSSRMLLCTHQSCTGCPTAPRPYFAFPRAALPRDDVSTSRGRGWGRGHLPECDLRRAGVAACRRVAPRALCAKGRLVRPAPHTLECAAALFLRPASGMDRGSGAAPDAGNALGECRGAADGRGEAHLVAQGGHGAETVFARPASEVPAIHLACSSGEVSRSVPRCAWRRDAACTLPASWIARRWRWDSHHAWRAHLREYLSQTRG